jgi:hypothetical protein
VHTPLPAFTRALKDVCRGRPSFAVTTVLAKPTRHPKPRDRRSRDHPNVATRPSAIFSKNGSAFQKHRAPCGPLAFGENDQRKDNSRQSQ